jgi:hypothetical protein
MNIKTKFDIGDTVFLMTYKNLTTETLCIHCNGTGVWTVKENNRTIECEECWGEGVTSEIDYNRKYWVVDKEDYIVSGINYTKSEGVSYSLSDKHNGCYDLRRCIELALTRTRNEAIIQCEKFNSQQQIQTKTKTRKEKRKQKHAKK